MFLQKFRRIRQSCHFRSVMVCIAIGLPFLITGLIIQQQARKQLVYESTVLNTILLSHAEEVIDDAIESLDNILPLLGQSCDVAMSSLQGLKANKLYIRTIGLVDKNIVYCSSLQRNVHLHVSALLWPETTLPDDISLQLLHDTPLVSARPALVFTKKTGPGQGIVIMLEIQYLIHLLQALDRTSHHALEIKIEGNLPISLQAICPPGKCPDKAMTVTKRSEKYDIETWVNVYPSTLTAVSVQLWKLYFPLILFLSLLGGYLVFRIQMMQGSLKQDIAKGIKRNQFFMIYQPIIDMTTDRCIGVEALLRWKHPLLGNIGPDIFIPVAENHGLCIPLTGHLLGLVARDLNQAWLPKQFQIGINILPEHLALEKIIQDIQIWQQAMHEREPRLVLEITERQPLSETLAVKHNMTELAKLNVSFSIDDFGTGHSSLGYLEQFDVDCLKIDRSFVCGIGTASVNVSVLDAIIALAGKLCLNLVAEGVETAEQCQYLRAQGVKYGQGYWFARPLMPAELKEWLIGRVG